MKPCTQSSTSLDGCPEAQTLSPARDGRLVSRKRSIKPECFPAPVPLRPRRQRTGAPTNWQWKVYGPLLAISMNNFST